MINDLEFASVYTSTFIVSSFKYMYLIKPLKLLMCCVNYLSKNVKGSGNSTKCTHNFIP